MANEGGSKKKVDVSNLIFQIVVVMLLTLFVVALGYIIQANVAFQKSINKKVSKIEKKVGKIEKKMTLVAGEISEDEPIKLFYENPRIRINYGDSKLDRIEDKVSNIELFLEDYLRK